MNDSKRQEIIDKYKLSNQELDQISKDVVEIEVSTLSSQTKPIIIFTGGQAGAGKSKITDDQEARFNEDIAIVDSDRYRGKHPKAIEIGDLYPSIASNATHQAGAGISNRVRDAAFDKSANILFDQTSRTPDGIKAITDRGKSQPVPYNVELHVIATDLDNSRMRVHSRYETGGGAPGGGRYVDEAFQKVSYDGIGDTVKAIEDEKVVDRIAIYDKKGKMIYDNSLKNGEWEKEPKAHETLLNERDRELSLSEKRELSQGWQRVKFQMDQRRASIEEPGIVEIANKGMQAAIDKHGIEIKDAEMVKAGRTYSGNMTLSSNDATLQQKNNGSAFIHPKSNLGNLTDADMGKAVKISYNQELKGSIVSREGISNESQKEIKDDRSIER